MESSSTSKSENKKSGGLRTRPVNADKHEDRIQNSSGRRQVFSDISNVPSSGDSQASSAAPGTKSKGSKSKGKGFMTTPKSRYDSLLEPGKPMPKGQKLFKCPKCTGPFLTPESSISSVNRRPSKLEKERAEGDDSEKDISSTNIETNRLKTEEKKASFLIPRDKRTPTAFKKEISSINNSPALEQQQKNINTTPNLPLPSSITPSYSIADSSSLSCSFQSLNTTCGDTDLSSNISFDILPSPEGFKENRDPLEMSPFSPIYYNRLQKQNDQNNDKKNLRPKTPPSSPNTRRRILSSGSYSAGCDVLRKQVLTNAFSKNLSQSISDLQSQSLEEGECESLQTSLILQKITQNQTEIQHNENENDEKDQSKTSEYSSSNFSVLRDASSFFNIHGSDYVLSPQHHGIVMKSFEENNKSYSPFNESITEDNSRENSSETQRKRQLSGNSSNDTQLNIPSTSKFCSHKEDKNRNSSLSIAQDKEDNDTILECPLCSHRFCSICMFIEHPGKPCHLIDADSLYSESDSSIASNLSSGSTRGKKERKNRLRRLARSR